MSWPGVLSLRRRRQGSRRFPRALFARLRLAINGIVGVVLRRARSGSRQPIHLGAEVLVGIPLPQLFDDILAQAGGRLLLVLRTVLRARTTSRGLFRSIIDGSILAVLQIAIPQVAFCLHCVARRAARRRTGRREAGAAERDQLLFAPPCGVVLVLLPLVDLWGCLGNGLEEFPLRAYHGLSYVLGTMIVIVANQVVFSLLAMTMTRCGRVEAFVTEQLPTCLLSHCRRLLLRDVLLLSKFCSHMFEDLYRLRDPERLPRSYPDSVRILGLRRFGHGSRWFDVIDLHLIAKTHTSLLL